MTPRADRAAQFLAMHEGPEPLLVPNPWDVGSTKLLASLGFVALATTSSGFAATLGRLDGSVTRDEAIEHASQLAGATDVPVTADLENGFADDPAGVADTVGLAIDAGLAGCSVEDFTRDLDEPLYEPSLAAARVAAAADVAHSGSARLVLTARADGLIHGRSEIDEVIARLQSFQAAGADVLYAPGLRDSDDIRRVVAAIDRPLNVLALPGCPTVAELRELGVRRVSVGGAFAWAAFAGAAQAARELLEHGTYGYYDQVVAGSRVARAAFS
ncbi:MAG: isocitrate lyase/PEP mutase family protein [Acidimicrobiales bacterium]